MRKLKKNSEIIKRSLVIVLAGLLGITAIIMLVLSFGKYDDGWGTDISIDMDYVVLALCSIALLVYGIYSVYAYHKKLSTKYAYYGAFGVISVLLCFYPLGVFFKAMAKQKPFYEFQEYLYVGFIGLILILYLAFGYISDSSKE